MLQTHKDVEIRGARYQVGLVRPHVGSYLLGILTGKMQAAAVEYQAKMKGAVSDAPTPDAVEPTQDERLMANATFLVSRLSLSESEEVQGLCLQRCSRYQDVGGKPVAMPILSGSTWLIPELEYDGPAVLQLVRECIAFNLSPFFSDAA